MVENSDLENVNNHQGGLTEYSYHVSEEIKHVWDVELDLLQKLLDVCEKHHLKIWAYGGTLLGAVRHQGFIPWDDDIDLAMFREDYDKLCSIASEEFLHPYFFQTEYTDQGSFRGHAQLRNSNTTGILKSEVEYADYNQGIFIDIFPLDTKIDNSLYYRIQVLEAKILKYLAKRLYWYPKGNHFNDKRLRYLVTCSVVKVLKCFVKPITIYRMFERVCQKYNYLSDSECVVAMEHVPGSIYDVFPRKCFKRIIWSKFEDMMIPVPEGYDQILRTNYGDYMTPRKNVAYHGGVIFNTNLGYKEYLANIHRIKDM